MCYSQDAIVHKSANYPNTAGKLMVTSNPISLSFTRFPVATYQVPQSQLTQFCTLATAVENVLHRVPATAISHLHQTNDTKQRSEGHQQASISQPLTGSLTVQEQLHINYNDIHVINWILSVK